MSESMQLLTTAEVAKRLRLSEVTLARLRVTGGGPQYIRLGRRVVYHPTDVDDWVDTHRRSHTAE